MAFFDDIPPFGDFCECDIFSVEPLVIGEVDEKVTATAVVARGFKCNPQGAFEVAHWRLLERNGFAKRVFSEPGSAAIFSRESASFFGEHGFGIWVTRLEDKVVHFAVPEHSVVDLLFDKGLEVGACVGGSGSVESDDERASVLNLKFDLIHLGLDQEGGYKSERANHSSILLDGLDYRSCVSSAEYVGYGYGIPFTLGRWKARIAWE